jgi:SMODS and SLOG-associating 2TM effector domain 1
VRREERGARSETEAERAEAFEAAGRQLVARCDVLVALWDGKKSRGRGGTASTLFDAALSSKPCIWISTEDLTVGDNLDRGQAEPFFREVERRAKPDKEEASFNARSPDVLAALRESLAALDKFNSQSFDADGSSATSELAVEPEEGRWVADPFVRASELAGRWQWRFKWMARTITLFAALAAVMLAVGLAFFPEEPTWTEAEAALFILALAGSFIVRRVELHRRWLSYRFLAERLRSARFLAPTGAEFRRQARLEPVFTGGRSTAWLMRAFEEVWDRRPPPSSPPTNLSDAELGRLKGLLADSWIGAQIQYHEKKSRHHRRWHRFLTTLVVLLFAATIAFALLHSKHVWEEASVFFSIALPAAGASLGVLLTVNQHQALSERYTRMKSDLTIARRNVLDAPPDSLDRTSSEAARVIAQETGAWFGSMWFLDIEHP